MILIITHKTDFTADFVINKLNKRQIKYKRFNCEDLFNSDYTIKINSDYSYSILGETNFHSVWFRRTKLPMVNSISKGEQLYLLQEADMFFKNLFSSLSANWLSIPNAVYEAENKLLQLKIAIQIGFLIPPTLITNSKEELREFYNEHNKNIIIKPLSQTRIKYNEGSAFIFTNPMPEYYINQLEEYDLTPCIYQKNILKDYEIRVTVVDEFVFASAVYSQQNERTMNDWRKEKLTFHQIDLPENISQMCLSIVKSLNLKFGAIDLIKTPSNDYIFLEINPNGQWAWIENQTGQKISDAIIKTLLN
jgi:glutathione synthase/RimK-type ligase-like ATP-grasp enzyme